MIVYDKNFHVFCAYQSVSTLDNPFSSDGFIAAASATVGGSAVCGCADGEGGAAGGSTAITVERRRCRRGGNGTSWGLVTVICGGAGTDRKPLPT